jgi:alanyl-tRNA synthetase
MGDMGKLTSDLMQTNVSDTKKTPDGKYYHIVEVKEGHISVGDIVKATVDTATRRAVQRNHSATHLLHKALKNRFGTQVGQAGSLVTNERLRFDFTLNEAISAEDLAIVEREVNQYILEAMAISWENMPIDEAKKLGATAMFGDKYGNVVRVVTMGDCSMELCGGCHMSNTSEIGLFKILSESGVAAGVRRIEAVTGDGVIREIYGLQKVINDTAEILKCSPKDLAKKAQTVTEELKAAHSQVESLNAKLAKGSEGEILDGAKEIGGITVVTGRVDGTDMDALRTLGDSLKAKLDCGFIALASVTDGKVSFVTMATKAATEKGAHAGNIIREIAKIAGGGGGGKPDSAQAGGKDPSKTDEALSAVYGLIEKL